MVRGAHAKAHMLEIWQSTVTMATIPNQKILCILRAVPARAPWCCELRFTFGIRS